MKGNHRILTFLRKRDEKRLQERDNDIARIGQNLPVRFILFLLNLNPSFGSFHKRKGGISEKIGEKNENKM